MNTSPPEIAAAAIGWDIDTWQNSLEFFPSKSSLSLSEKTKVLELGAGGKFGGLSLWLASLGCDVTCSNNEDLSEETKAIHKKYGFKNIHYKKLDALKMEEDEKYDVIVFKSMVGGIARNYDIDKAKAVFDNCQRILKKGGELWFAENLRSSWIHRLARNLFGAGKNKWSYFNIPQFNFLTKDFNDFSYETHGFLSLFSRSGKLGKLDKKVYKHLPKDWRYMICGVAKN